ncbi:MAG: hypothetical protein A3H69_03230 [Candidatus Sungbacteria bacterium RIFCSPLOWO2_02_FULL_47_9]|uniref:Nudix hydrolase domain-containing protein n=2 Tax=Parcubacteria group TaxID=1794811 RepID=A0A1G2RS95_9BACT|nr:MAG: MutT related protein [Parcubacteria group bacterium GW2011_GWA2_47_10]OGZ93952.1 MAG: hypothetical protein A2633_00730 [Candidatus Sungbacteria bacterium RIFCSPHIGHO2_01_FULL_47_32]OHA10400.1 MAG: hypothetical protein A3H69_03230 [Candidatus Sungbacteria bacterium RIFCSPLOWO2_02_FULL_47_9]OHA74931.1 MAG: hypothetical protein A3A32_03735 [Candidatus Wildermuthbacteria bacterium RIFCSPLOWO2_01_FULL_48_35]
MIILQVGVKILLHNKENKYLLLRRSAEKYPDVRGRWDIVGGRINPGTTLLENLKREVQEETGLSIDGAPQLIAAQDILSTADRQVVRLTYVGRVAGGAVVLDVTENDMYKWVTWEEMSEMDDLDMYVRELLNDISLRLVIKKAEVPRKIK